MGLIILGKNRDDKGTQLEQLTKTLLKYQGYTNIATNVQVGGGSELDVTAVRKETTGIRDIITPVLCECKAHQSQIALPDWLKFIGKLAISRRSNERTIGLMLALSGANGNVIGSYNDDFANDDTVQLIANDELFSLLQKIFHLPGIDDIRSMINNIPGLDAEDIDLVYYKKKLYWLVSLGNQTYTLCDATGHLADNKSINDILPLLKTFTSYDETGYIDVFQGFELQRRLEQLKVRLINELANGRTINKKVLESLCRDTGTGTVELEKVVKDSPYIGIAKVKNKKTVKLKKIQAYGDFYRYVLTTGTPVELFTSDYYQRHIDNNLLEEIWKIQGGFQVEEEEKENCLKILNLSPSALLYALSPDDMLKNYSAIKHDDGMKNLYQSHFKSELTQRLRNDFQNQGLHLLFLSLGVDSATIETKMKVGNTVENFTLESRQNFKLMRLQNNGQAVMIVAKDDV